MICRGETFSPFSEPDLTFVRSLSCSPGYLARTQTVMPAHGRRSAHCSCHYEFTACYQSDCFCMLVVRTGQKEQPDSSLTSLSLCNQVSSPVGHSPFRHQMVSFASPPWQRFHTSKVCHSVLQSQTSSILEGSRFDGTVRRLDGPLWMCYLEATHACTARHGFLSTRPERRSSMSFHLPGSSNIHDDVSTYWPPTPALGV